MLAHVKCILHGSFRKHFDLIKEVYTVFNKAGIEVIAPKISPIAGYRDDFALFEGEENTDSRLIELLYLQNLKKLGKNGFSYFVNPEGYIGRTTSYELGIAQAANVPCFFYSAPVDHPVYLHKNSVTRPQGLIEYIQEKGGLPKSQFKRSEARIHKLWQELTPPSLAIAVGAMIEYLPRRTAQEKEILLVKTHQWGNQYSIIGERIKPKEKIAAALQRGIKEETGLNSNIGQHLCTFNQLDNSRYHRPGVSHIFIDHIAQVKSKKVRLNEEAQSYVWMPAKLALQDLPIEPNARHTLELYSSLSK